MKLIWSPLAVERVSEIAKYIARDNATAAERWVHAIFNKAKRLERFPESGRQVPELDRRDVREIFHQPYRIIYRLEKGQIAILTVRHGKQILPVDELK